MPLRHCLSSCVLDLTGSLRTSSSRLLRPRIRYQRQRTISSISHQYRRAIGNDVALLALIAATSLSAGFFLHRGLSKQPEITTKATQGKPLYARKPELAEVIEKLESKLGEDAITTDDDELKRHGYSEWSTINIDSLPIAIAYPKTTEDVAEIAKLCNEHRIPLVPYSGGSSVEGNFSAPYGGICIDFAMMDQVLAVHEDDLDVVVQPGIGWVDLNKKIENTGLFFPVDPGPSAMIGGMVGTSCSGTNAVRYGTMKDNVVNLTVVLADGTSIKTKGRPRKSAAGYNLTNMFIGSEGTLGIVTEITLKLAIIPAETSIAVATFPSIGIAAATAQQILKSGVQVGALEIMDDVQMDVVNRVKNTSRVWKLLPTLFIKLSGTKGQVTEAVGLVEKMAKANESASFELATAPDEQHELWSARKQALWSMLALRTGNEEAWSTDVAVPPSRLAELIDISKKELSDLGLFASILGHVGDGNFHETIIYDAQHPTERSKVAQCVKRMVDRALRMEGTCTGEHGVGIGKKGHLVGEVGVNGIMVMQKIKEALDPNWIMNPGKIFDHPLEDRPVGH